jgi:hypothetical protein
MNFDFVQNSIQNHLDDIEYDEYFKILIQIIDYEFIRETQPEYKNYSNNEIFKLINENKNKDIIVSNKHVQFIVQDDLFDYIYYKNNYIVNNSILKIKSINEILDNYLLNNKKKIIYSNDHAKQITENKYFDIDFYKSNYDDLNKMTPYELVIHYIKWGKKEGRIVSNEHAQYLTNEHNFDVLFYKSHYNDLEAKNLHQVVNHYINWGKKEGRKFSKKVIQFQ